MLVLVACAGLARQASAADTSDAVVAALQTDRLYIDPNFTIPPADRSQLQSAVDDCATPLFLTLLPAGDPVTVQDIHSGLGQLGVYAVLTGSHFTAAATGGLLPTGRANQLALQATTKPSRTAGLLWFIQEVNQEPSTMLQAPPLPPPSSRTSSGT